QLHERALRLIAEARTPFIHLVAVTEAEEQRARELLESGLQSTRAGDGLAAAHDFARAFACNPYSDDAADALETYLRPLAAPSAREDQRPSFLSGARSFCTLAFADELIADPDLL